MNSIDEIFASEDFRIERCERRWRSIRQALVACREERRPYLIRTERINWSEPLTILVPVSRLEEEVYKAEICTYLARKTGARIILLVAKDYGSRARTNAEKIITRIRKISAASRIEIQHEVLSARRDSDHLMREAAGRMEELGADLLLLTASREYGLDDEIFGPQELWAIRSCPKPVLLVNPREDLFSLCD